MSINAGIRLLSFDGTQMFDETTQTWKNISGTINYPPDQNINDNPPEPGAVLIEESGVVWRVVSVVIVDVEANTVTLELEAYEGETTAEQSPKYGTTSRAGIVTPVKGYIGPYWNATVVDTTVGRIAGMLNMENMETFSTGGGETFDVDTILTSDTGVLSDADGNVLVYHLDTDSTDPTPPEGDDPIIVPAPGPSAPH